MADSAITFTPGEVSAYYTARVPHLKQRQVAEWRGACPVHHGEGDNFAVDAETGVWFCHSNCKRGGDILDLEEALIGGDFPTRKVEVFRLVGRSEPEYRHDGTRANGHSAGTAPTKPTKPTGTAGGWREIARYPYVDRNGNLLFEVVRFQKPDGSKAFKQCRPDGRGGVIWKLDGIERVPYHLPQLLNAETVYLPEGEACVATLEAWDLVASCNPGGSGSSHLYLAWADYFRDRHVVVLPDNDAPGRKHAVAVAAALLPAAASVRIVELPGLPMKGDVTDWRDAGGTFERFRELTEAAAPIDAAALSELRARWALADQETHQQATCAEAADDWLDRTAAVWPHGLRDEAYHGPVGELVRAIEPHSEADPAALLVQFLVGFGNVIGRRAHFMAEADRHFMNLFTVLVGRTSKGRKGVSFGQVLRVLEAVDAPWRDTRIMGGLASGEGLIWRVRDEIRETAPVREKGRVVGYEKVLSDAGETDKRLLVFEPEFARVLQVTERECNTLSAIVRQAWDSGNLCILTKTQAARSTEAHISVVGHITKHELNRLLTETAAGNGFANRFLWVCAQRSKLLPEGGALHTVDFVPMIQRLQAAAEFARGTQEMKRDEQARAIWRDVYPELSEGKPGLLGSVTSRAEAQVMRLACIYALLDCSAVVRAEHLIAALEVWRYCEDSARFVFGDALGDATADEIIRELRQHPEGMTRNDIREHFSRNKSSREIGRALGVLLEYGLARVQCEREDESQKRPPERWFAAYGVRGLRA